MNKKPLWTPSDNCDLCHNTSSWKTASKIGEIIEFSKKDANYFALIEISDGIKILGSIVGKIQPEIGQSVELEKCSFNDGPKFIFKLCLLPKCILIKSTWGATSIDFFV